MSFKTQSHYDVLGVGKLAAQKEIKLAYYKKCKKLHPDTNNSSKKNSHGEFVRLNEAYSILSNPSSRRDYDSSFFSSYNYPNPTNVYKNNNYNQSRAKYTSYSNPFDDYQHNQEHYEEQMRFYREQMRYSSYYRPGQNYQTEEPKPVPFKTLFTVALIICTIFLFDAIFVTMTYNHDMNNLQKNYNPMSNRRWKKNGNPPSEYDDQEINESKKYEADIDKKIREFKEYESKTNVRIYQMDEVKD